MVPACVLGLIVFAHVGLPAGTAHAYVLKTTKTGQLVRWSESTVSLRVDPKLRGLFGKQQLQAALSMASDAWRGLPGVPQIVVSDEAAPGYTLSRRTNGVYLMNPWPFPKDQLAVTVSTYATNGRMIGADVLINADVRYALLDDGTDHPEMPQHDLGAVLTHEFGHVLGLDESPDDESATMWPYIRAGEVHQRTLADDDEQGVIEAYAGAAPVGAAVGCGPASVVGAQPVSAAAWAWPLVIVGLAGWRRRRQPHRAPVACG
jgi:MYXO-CTERM domain-containing protein